MKKTVKFTAVLLVLCVCVSAFASCGSTQDEDGVSVVTTIFASYDFARAVAGENASVKMLVSPGADIHSYDPSPKDILAVSKCDVFIYVGGASDVWVDEILASANNPDMKIIKLMDYTEGLICSDHEHGEGGHGHGHEEYDEHVWTSPKNAILACKAIAEALIEADAEHADAYKSNLEAYKEALTALDADIAKTVSEAKRKLIVFGDRFPLIYFTSAYGIEYESAFPGCAGETEPDAATVAKLIKLVKDENIPVVFYLALSTGNIADTICEATGAKKTAFNACQNVSKTDFENGVTYLELMQKNAEALKTALN